MQTCQPETIHIWIEFIYDVWTDSIRHTTLSWGILQCLA